jgi:hypothetical protein
MVFVAASSHPSRRERESERQITSRSRVGQSWWPRGRTNTTTIVLESQPTARTMVSPPAVVGPDIVLLAAHQLFNNPPPVGASPSVAEQWRHDVDQLIIATINTPHRGGGASHLRSSRAFCQWRVRRLWRRRPRGCQVRARRRSTARRWPAIG